MKPYRLHPARKGAAAEIFTERDQEKAPAPTCWAMSRGIPGLTASMTKPRGHGARCPSTLRPIPCATSMIRYVEPAVMCPCSRCPRSCGDGCLLKPSMCSRGTCPGQRLPVYRRAVPAYARSPYRPRDNGTLRYRPGGCHWGCIPRPDTPGGLRRPASTIESWLKICHTDAFSVDAAVPMRYFYMLPVEASASLRAGG